MSQVALAWINQRITSPNVGFSTIGKIDDAIGVRGKPLTMAAEKDLEELYVPKAIQGRT